MQPLGDAPWKLSEIEFARATSLGSDERYAYTVNAVREHGELYCLGDDNGWCLGFDDAGRQVFPIWPHPSFAREAAVGEWGHYYPTAVKLVAFLSGAIQPIGYPLAIFTSFGQWVLVPFSHFKAHILGPRQNHYAPAQGA